MAETHAPTATNTLAKYYGSNLALTEESAREIVTTLWPGAEKASPVEVFKAVNICRQYGLNPLMGHLFLIPFTKREKRDDKWVTVGTTYATVLGIKASRLIASRKHAYSYISDTPRLMAKDEQVQVFGEVDMGNLRAICILKDMKTGATARGYGTWPIESNPQGMDKGNSKANMAFIRAERQALDRLYPADMPGAEIPVVDDRFEQMPMPGERQTESASGPEIVTTIDGDGVIQEATSAVKTGQGAEEQPKVVAEAKPPSSKPAPARADLMAMTFANAGEMLTACVKHLKIQKSQLAIDVPEYDLNDAKQRATAWQALVGIHWQGE